MKADTLLIEDNEPRSLPTEIDCLRRADVTPYPAQTERCIATIASRGFAVWLDDMLGSLLERGQCHGALTVVLVVDADPECLQVVRGYQALYPDVPLLAIPVRSLEPVNQWIKGVIYSIARFIDAKYFVCIEADMLVLSSLAPLFELLESLEVGDEAQSTKFVGVQAPWTAGMNLQQSFAAAGGRIEDAELLLRDIEPHERPRAWETLTAPNSHFTMFNGGLIAGRRESFMCLDGLIRRMQEPALAWMEERRGDIPWREEFVFNFAAHLMHAHAAISDVWNVQLHTPEHLPHVQIQGRGAEIRATLHGDEVKILHFVHWAKRTHAHLRGSFARILGTSRDAG